MGYLRHKETTVEDIQLQNNSKTQRCWWQPRTWSKDVKHNRTISNHIWKSPLRTPDTESHRPYALVPTLCLDAPQGVAEEDAGTLAVTTWERARHHLNQAWLTVWQNRVSSQLIHADHCWFSPTFWQPSRGPRGPSRILSMEPLEWAYSKSNMHTTSWHLLGTERINHVSN